MDIKWSLVLLFLNLYEVVYTEENMRKGLTALHGLEDEPSAIKKREVESQYTDTPVPLPTTYSLKGYVSTMQEPSSTALPSENETVIRRPLSYLHVNLPEENTSMAPPPFFQDPTVPNPRQQQPNDMTNYYQLKERNHAKLEKDFNLMELRPHPETKTVEMKPFNWKYMKDENKSSKSYTKPINNDIIRKEPNYYNQGTVNYLGNEYSISDNDCRNECVLSEPGLRSKPLIININGECASFPNERYVHKFVFNPNSLKIRKTPYFPQNSYFKDRELNHYYYM